MPLGKAGAIVFNDGWRGITGYDMEYWSPMHHDRWDDYYHPEDLMKNKEMLNRHFNREIDFFELEMRVKRKGGGWVWILERGQVMEWSKKGEPLRMYGTAIDISFRKNAEEMLLLEKERTENVIEGTDAGTWERDLATNKVTFNNRWAQMIGYESEELDNDFLSFKKMVHPEDLPLLEKAFDDHYFGRKKSYEVEFRMKHKQHHWIWILSKGKIMYNEVGEGVKFSGTHQDITDKKKAEEVLLSTNKQLVKTLDQKESLFKELHHRIKNHLQLISSILYIESTGVESEETLHFIKDVSGRINSLSKLHDQLLRLEEVSDLEIGEYIRDIATGIIKSTATDPDLYPLNIKIEENILDIDTALMLGLIVNEALSNTLKHAYDKEKGGPIFINFKKTAKNYHLKVWDQGVGITNQKKNNSSIGMKLIDIFTDQLQGQLTTNFSKGVRYEALFPIR